MAQERTYMVFDIESVGIHGVGYAAGWVVITESGEEIHSGRVWTNPANQPGTPEDHAWLKEFAPRLELPLVETRREVRKVFWDALMYWKAQGAILVADCPWPVESRFLIDCIEDNPEARKWQGPYPLLDVGSVRAAVGLDPVGSEHRLPDELPVHNPLADARQSARLFLEALRLGRSRQDVG